MDYIHILKTFESPWPFFTRNIFIPYFNQYLIQSIYNNNAVTFNIFLCLFFDQYRIFTHHFYFCRQVIEQVLQVIIRLSNLLLIFNVLALLYQYIELMKKQGQVIREDVPRVLQSHLPQYKPELLKIKSTIGMTNKTFTVTGEGLAPVIFRILNQSIDRKYESKILQRLDACKLCPKNLYNSDIYRIEEFVQHAKHPDAHQIVSNSHLLELIIRKLYEVHSIQLPPELDKNFFDHMVFNEECKQKYLKAHCQEMNKEKQHQSLKNELISMFDSVSESIHKHFQKRTRKLCLCHNDMNNNNIFIKKFEGKQDLIFIDFQYACLNYSAYDIANFLNECCFEYTKEFPGCKVYKKVTEQEIKKTCQFYPGKYKTIENDVKFMLKICNFFWALWSLQAHSTPTFSPIQHGRTRLELYKYYNQKFLN